MILPKIRVLHSHGRQAIPDLDAVELTPEFRGRPCLTETRDADDAEHAAAVCPTGAFTAAPLALDLGRCLFCGECARIAPRNVRFTNDYRIGSPTREGLVVRPGDTRIAFDAGKVRPEIRRCFSRALQLREVSAGGDASVEMELGATGNVNFDLGRFGIGFTASPRHADGVVVSGPVTVNMAEALEICYDAVAEPKILVACGSEACSGGLFADSRAVDRRTDPPDDLHRRDDEPAGPQNPPMTMQRLTTIFVSFLKIGMFTFGGGYAMLPLIERELITKRKWIEQKEFLDLLTLAQSVPGPIAVNTSVFVGYKVRGLRGAAAALLGTVTPSFVIILVIAIFFAGIRQNPVVDAAFKGADPRPGAHALPRHALDDAGRHRRLGPGHLVARLVADLDTRRGRRAGHRLGVDNGKKGER